MASDLFVQLTSEPRLLIATVMADKIGARESEIIEAEIKRALPERAWRVIIDMSKVTVLASMGLGMLVTLHKLCGTNGGRLAVMGMNAELLSLLKVTHLDKVLKIVPDKPAALKILG